MSSCLRATGNAYCFQWKEGTRRCHHHYYEHLLSVHEVLGLLSTSYTFLSFNPPCHLQTKHFLSPPVIPPFLQVSKLREAERRSILGSKVQPEGTCSPAPVLWRAPQLVCNLQVKVFPSIPAVSLVE